MFIASIMSLSYWNSLTNSYLAELILALTVAIVIVIEHRVGPRVHKSIPSRFPLLRGLIFLCLCALAALVVAWALKAVLAFFGGQYIALVALALIIIVALTAKR
ncbi:MAG: hypothetical protein MUC50_13090 [Myxococcota bacterium]|jgi:hypothetical protein|nr:hypothetical protein [Myxococcota bacterium]